MTHNCNNTGRIVRSDCSKIFLAFANRLPNGKMGVVQSVENLSSMERNYTSIIDDRNHKEERIP
jgi:hypothetical protein